MTTLTARAREHLLNPDARVRRDTIATLVDRFPPDSPPAAVAALTHLVWHLAQDDPRPEAIGLAWHALDHSAHPDYLDHAVTAMEEP